MLQYLDKTAPPRVPHPLAVVDGSFCIETRRLEQTDAT